MSGHRKYTPLESHILKLLPVGSLVWVVRNGKRHYQEMVLDIMVLPPGILVVLTVTYTIAPPKPQRFRAYLSATNALPPEHPQSLKQLPVTYRSYYRALQPPKSGTTLTFQDVVFAQPL